MPKSVWIIYREYSIGPHFQAIARKVEGVVWTEAQAKQFAKDLKEEMDERFGCSYQEWIIDADYEPYHQN